MNPIQLVGNVCSIFTLFMLIHLIFSYIPSLVKRIDSLEKKVIDLEKPLPKSVQLLNRKKERARQKEIIDAMKKEEADNDKD